MLYTVMWLVMLSVFFVVVYYLIKTAIDTHLLIKMQTREKQFRSRNINPAGSSLAHGMCMNLKTKDIEHDQIESISWYKRLVG